MVVKKVPQSLQTLSLHTLCQAMLQQWKNTYYTNFSGYAEHFINEMSVLIPPIIFNQVFDLMVDTHARYIQSTKTIISSNHMSISALVQSIILPNLHKLNLHCLRHIGIVCDEEIEYLDAILTSKLPYLRNLVEINLQTCGKDNTLPICTDEILNQIGSTCFKLTNLDVSYNYVTDNGLRFLIPSETRVGCPQLVKVSLFECSVTQEGIAELLEGLPKLKFLGYRETGQTLKILHHKVRSYPTFQPLQLAHINNMGRSNHTCKTFHELELTSTEVNIISKLCPSLNGLKLRVKDSSVMVLKNLSTVTIVELVYNLGKPSSPSSNTVQYLQLCGAQFVQLSLVCDVFSSQCLKVICEQCNNLKRLYLSSNTFNIDGDITMQDKKKCVLTDLEKFKFKTGYDSLSDPCHIPFNIFNYVLHKSHVLTEVVLTMKNSLLSDMYIEDLFSSIETSKIKSIWLQSPRDKCVCLSPLSLTMMTVENLIGMCPELVELGKLLVWDVSLEEIEDLRRQLQLTNSALVTL